MCPVAVMMAGCAEAQGPDAGQAVAAGWKVERSRERWTVAGDLKAPANISGIALLDGDRFLIGSDDLLVAQAGTIDRKRNALVVTETVRLLGSKDDDEIDIEGIAAAQGENCYYVTGSHSLTKKGNMNRERRSVFRVASRSGGRADWAIERESLEDNIKRDPALRRFWEQPQQLGGINIEGLAWRQGKLLFGFRSPNIDDHAMVLQVDAAALFRKGTDPHQLLRVPLGDGLGIREMAVIAEGILIVAGNAGDEPTPEFPVPRDYSKNRPYQLFLWNPDNNQVQRLMTFHGIPGRPEAMCVLADSQQQAELLVLFDGVAGGSPTRYLISKK